MMNASNLRRLLDHFPSKTKGHDKKGRSCLGNCLLRWKPFDPIKSRSDGWLKKIAAMNTIQKENPILACCEGMLCAAFSVRNFRDNVAEWQIDAVKKRAKELKDEDVVHAAITPAAEENQTRLRKQ